MRAIRSILAATDLSAPARHAAGRAARLAGASGASLALVHALSRPAVEEMRRLLGAEDAASRSLLDAAAQRLHALAGELQERHGVSADERVVVGAVVDEIVRAADEVQADLVVTGTRGASFVRSLLVGATAERVVKRSRRPVLMVRHTPRDDYARVLLPVDFSEWTLPAIEIARQVAPTAQFLLMHAVGVPFEGHLRYAGVTDTVVAKYLDRARREARERLAEAAAQAGLPPHQWLPLTPSGSDPWMQVVEQEQEQDCDLVVIGKHGRHAVEELILGSTTHMVIAECSGDVLVSSTRGASSDESDA